MITLHAMRNVDGDKLYAYDFCGLSTDEKPQTYGGKELEANSLFLELDTGDFYYLETPAQSGEEVLIPQQSFTGDNEGYYSYYYADLTNTTLEPNGVTPLHVIFDGTEYTAEAIYEPGEDADAYRYGAIKSGGNYDFSTYPFSIMAGDGWVECFVGDGNEHTIEAYAESTTPAVWKKVGSGASPSPSGDGYEINNPILTFEVDNQTDAPILLSYGDVNNDGYLTDVELYAPIGENIMNLVVLGLIGNGETSYTVVLESIPSSVNYTDNCSYSDGVITITDPSQDAVINIEYHVGG